MKKWVVAVLVLIGISWNLSLDSGAGRVAWLVLIPFALLIGLVWYLSRRGGGFSAQTGKELYPDYDDRDD